MSKTLIVLCAGSVDGSLLRKARNLIQESPSMKRDLFPLPQEHVGVAIEVVFIVSSSSLVFLLSAPHVEFTLGAKGLLVKQSFSGMIVLPLLREAKSIKPDSHKGCPV